MFSLKVRGNLFNDSFITAEFSLDGGNAADTEPQTSVLSAVSCNKLVSKGLLRGEILFAIDHMNEVLRHILY